MRQLIPDTIATRTLMVLIIGLMVSHVLSVALYLGDRTSALMFTGGEHIAGRIASIGKLAENASQADRLRIVALADSPGFHVSWSLESAVDDGQDGDWQAEVLRNALSAHLGDLDTQPLVKLGHMDHATSGPWKSHMLRDHQPNHPDEMLLASLQLPDGSWLNFAAPVGNPEPFWSLRFALSLLLMLLAVGGTSALVVRHLTKPLGRFARAAERLGTDVKAPPMPEHGPAEVRRAAHAFNEMQGRIRRFVEDRTQMLAAISHDLGTPITRLRLRAEFVEGDEQKKKMLADLDEMQAMVHSALSFVRDDAAKELRVMVDLRSLLQRVCDEMVDTGHEVTLDIGDDAVRYGCRPAALRRALTNLIDNAFKYGHRARVSLRDDEDGVLIRIDDDGPGIPEELQEDAFRPFCRLEASRSRETGGTGLGLAVARTIIRAHGGDISLTNRGEGGLRVEIWLPR